MQRLALFLSTALATAPMAGTAWGQTEATGAAEAENAELLTQAELETLVAPVALYPDTLLIQILVAATQPLEIVKADRFLLQNDGADPEALRPEIEAQGWDPSVEVLATGFPDVVADMAEHIEWTETMGAAMEAQTDGVMDAVQTMRLQAINTGALLSSDEQVVEVDSDETVVIQPADPEVVYVPQYDPQVVYDSSLDDALMVGAVTFGTFLLVDAIFDDDDDWNDYWGCRNCGGWGGGPIIRDPDIDIDVDGDVTIGDGNIDLGGWKPDPDRTENARDKIADRRDPEGGGTRLPINKGDSNSDALRERLSDRTGAADISRPGGASTGPAVIRPGGGSSERLPQVDRPSQRPSGEKRDAIARTRDTAPASSARPAEIKRPASVQKPASVQRPAAVKKPTALAKRSPGPKAHAASQRGGGHKRTRR
ncbi:DUF3300 domain-containing protein [Palleronia sp. KMU-117]|uniref:DUF3300 domain-containing protein n=1 Tax=Palleronia sp. KMU-117 TaxID=3434108 RepID=UPI003D759BCA